MGVSGFLDLMGHTGATSRQAWERCASDLRDVVEGPAAAAHRAAGPAHDKRANGPGPLLTPGEGELVACRLRRTAPGQALGKRAHGRHGARMRVASRIVRTMAPAGNRHDDAGGEVVQGNGLPVCRARVELGHARFGSPRVATAWVISAKKREPADLVAGLQRGLGRGSPRARRAMPGAAAAVLQWFAQHDGQHTARDRQEQLSVSVPMFTWCWQAPVLCAALVLHVRGLHGSALVTRAGGSSVVACRVRTCAGAWPGLGPMPSSSQASMLANGRLFAQRAQHLRAGALGWQLERELAALAIARRLRPLAVRDTGAGPDALEPPQHDIGAPSWSRNTLPGISAWRRRPRLGSWGPRTGVVGHVVGHGLSVALARPHAAEQRASTCTSNSFAMERETNWRCWCSVSRNRAAADQANEAGTTPGPAQPATARPRPRGMRSSAASPGMSASPDIWVRVRCRFIPSGPSADLQQELRQVDAKSAAAPRTDCIGAHHDLQREMPWMGTGRRPQGLARSGQRQPQALLENACSRLRAPAARVSAGAERVSGGGSWQLLIDSTNVSRWDLGLRPRNTWDALAQCVIDLVGQLRTGVADSSRRSSERSTDGG
ncbi:hypothetical protein FQR65_LT20317 [Abscondita terminalis]|nr:hypothetical protein FQR65_LT20317 [Abscondita terminalis]